MLCMKCHGTRTIQVEGKAVPCPECEGRGEIHCCEGLVTQPEADSPELDRRAFLRVGGLGALGLTLPTLLAADARGSDYGNDQPVARARNCILLFLSGGPSQYESFDPKPEAPSDTRSIFATIPS